MVAVYPSKGMEEVEVKERWTNPLLPSIAGGQQNTARQNLCVFVFKTTFISVIECNAARGPGPGLGDPPEHVLFYVFLKFPEIVLNYVSDL